MKELKIYRPLSTNYITQQYGQSKACVHPNGRVVSKLAGNVCPIGSVDLYKSIGMLYHNGIDFAAWYGEPTYHSANFDGWFRSEIDQAGGIGVDIVSNEPILKCTEPDCNETHYIKTRYWHNSSLIGHDKKPIKMGDFIALAGSTGMSSGVHSHTGIKWCDKDGNGLHRNNGTYGAFDPTPYYTNVFVIKQARIDNIVRNIKEEKLTLIDVLNKYVMLLRIEIYKIKQKLT